MKWKWRYRIHETPHNLVEMHHRFEKYNQNLHKIIENRENRVRKRHMLHKTIDLETGKRSRYASISNASSPRISDTDSIKSEDENEVFNEIMGATMDNSLFETSL